MALALLALAYASTGWGQVYSKFGPATGVLKGSTATYQTSAATSADIRGLWTGTCSASTFLRGDGACAVAGGGGGTPGGSDTDIQFNDSGSFGGAAAFTWDKTTSTVTLTDLTLFNAQSFVTLAAPSTSNGPHVVISGTFSGVLFANGSSGYGQVGCPSCLNGSGSTTDFQIQSFDSASSIVLSGGEGDSTASFNNLSIKLGDTTGTTAITGYGLNAGGYVDMSPDSGSFTATISAGCTTTPTGTLKWFRQGAVVTLQFPSGLSCTSNAATFSITGVPAAIQPPANAADFASLIQAQNAGVAIPAAAQVFSSISGFGGTITLVPVISGVTWTSTGTKSVGPGTLTYILN